LEYLTYEEYKNLGGAVDQSAFPKLERQARRKLDYFTQNRIVTVDSDIKEVMAGFIDMLNDNNVVVGLSSYSNGIESFGYSENVRADLNDNMFQIAKEILPTELITQVVDYV